MAPLARRWGAVRAIPIVGASVGWGGAPQRAVPALGRPGRRWRQLQPLHPEAQPRRRRALGVAVRLGALAAAVRASALAPMRALLRNNERCRDPRGCGDPMAGARAWVVAMPRAQTMPCRDPLGCGEALALAML